MNGCRPSPTGPTAKNTTQDRARDEQRARETGSVVTASRRPHVAAIHARRMNRPRHRPDVRAHGVREMVADADACDARRHRDSGRPTMTPIELAGRRSR